MENLNAYQIALEQFDRAADRLKLDGGLAEILRHPKRQLSVSIPTVQDLQGFFWDEDQVNNQLERIIKRAFNEVNETAVRERVDRRTAAYVLAVKCVAEATRVRGLFP